MLIRSKEADVSHQFEVKPFRQVTPEEVARACGGSVRYYKGEPIAVTCDHLRVSIVFSGDASCMMEEGEEGKRKEYPLGDTRVILEDGSVTFVEPAHSRQGVEYYNWTIISEKDGFSRVRKTAYQRTYQDLKFVHEAWDAARGNKAS